MPYPTIPIVVALLATLAVAQLTGGILARAGFPLPAHDTRLGCVDGLRGCLALSVMAHHFIMWMGATRFGVADWAIPDVPVYNELGAGAVALFFMTTGFVFYRRVLAGFGGTSWPAVITTRVFRILPLVILSVAIVAAIAMSRTGHALGRADLPALALWIAAWSEPGLAGLADAGRINAYVLWSLRFEWIFYLALLPAAALSTDAIRGRLPSAAVPVGLILVAAIGGTTHFAPTLMRALPHFAVGMLAYECHSRPAIAARLRSRAVAVLALAALLGAALVWPFPIGAALPAFGFFFICVACGNDLFGLLRTRGALVLGEISFSIYLLHGIVLSLFFVEGGRMVASMPTGALPFRLPLLALVVVLLSSVSYLAIERPAMRFGARLARRWTHLRIRSRAPEVEFAP